MTQAEEREGRRRDRAAEKARIEAHDLEKHADTIIRTMAAMQMEAMRLFARAALLRRDQ